MARYIRVSSLSVRGGVNYAGDLNKDLKLETDRMIDSWNRLLQNVLPNEPNLIVLPKSATNTTITLHPDVTSIMR